MDLGFRGWVSAERPRFVKAVDVSGLPIASSIGLFLEPKPKPMLKRVFVLGLLLKALGSDLGCSLGLILCLVLGLGLRTWVYDIVTIIIIIIINYY